MAAPGTEPPHEEKTLARMSFGDHLEELRRRLMYSLIALAVCVFALMPFKSQVTSLYIQPYRQMWIQGFETYVRNVEKRVAERGGLAAQHELVQDRVRFLRRYQAAIIAGTFPIEEADKIRTIGGYQVSYTLVALGGLEDFWTFMAASLLFAVMFAAPFILYQAWAFIGAGLYRHERSVFYRYVPFAIVLLMAGIAFGYFVVVPYGLYFLVQFMNWAQVQPMFSVAQYFSLFFTLTAALAFVFQLPLVMLALTKVGIVTHEGWKKQWRFVILGFFAASAMLTPPDPFTQVMMATPMILLYVLGLRLTSRAGGSTPKLVGEE